MKKTVLLIEPNYKNKYPPMGLMKLAMYHRKQGFDVRFYKGELQDFVACQYTEMAIRKLNDLENRTYWGCRYEDVKQYIKKGSIEPESSFDNDTKKPFVLKWLMSYRKLYLTGVYPEEAKFDRVMITTLFTFYWDITIETINFAKRFLKDGGHMQVGGVLATVLADRVKRETGIAPHKGILSCRKLYPEDKSLGVSIDDLPLDYSILDEVDYEYPAKNAYYAYTTRGCVNKCPFCVVPRLEPEYKSSVGIKRRIRETDLRFGAQRDLLLLDNNVLASDKFNQIIDEIRTSGFEAGATFIPVNQLDVTIRQLEDGWNDRAYIRRGLKQIAEYASKLVGEEADLLAKEIAARGLDSVHTATKEDVLSVCRLIRDGYDKRLSKRPVARVVDFNQGLDARLFTDEKAAKLASVAIRPLRVAFDDWRLRDKYVRALYLANRHGIRSMSNYVLYNFHDEPIDLFNRLRLNNELNEAMDVVIYSFPMKYQPIVDPEYFANRKFVGEHWCRKDIRAIQAILNATHGQVGRGYAFFQAAFGRTEDDFLELLRMPESYIKRRWDAEVTGAIDSWRHDYAQLDEESRLIAHDIVNSESIYDRRAEIGKYSKKLQKYLGHYLISFEKVKKAPDSVRKKRIKEFNEACVVEISEETKRLLRKAEEGV